MDHFETLKADFATLVFKISRGVIEGFAEFDRHVRRHAQPENIFAARVVDQRFDGDERATWRERIVSCADELDLFLQIPIVQNHSHRDHASFWQRILKEIT